MEALTSDISTGLQKSTLLHEHSQGSGHHTPRVNRIAGCCMKGLIRRNSDRWALSARHHRYVTDWMGRGVVPVRLTSMACDGPNEKVETMCASRSLESGDGYHL